MLAFDPDRVATLKESHLKQIAGRDILRAEEISAALPVSLAALAPAIAEALLKVTSSAEKVDAPPAERVHPPEPPLPRVESPAPPNPRATVLDSAPPRAAQEVHTGGTGSDNLVPPEGFAVYAYGAAGSEPIDVMTSAGTEGGVRLAWEAKLVGLDEVVIYRVVAGEEHPPYSPDQAVQISSTRILSAVDVRPFESAVRHFQVWAYVGSNIANAPSAQPVLHAEVSRVAPPIDVRIRTDERRVIGRWSVYPRTIRVHVFRVPIELVRREAGSPQHRIAESDSNLGGFDDGLAIPGRKYLYMVQAEANDGAAAKLSDPITSEIFVPDVLEPVTDLVATPAADDDFEFLLSWTRPNSGHVDIYRTLNRPQAGLDREVRDEGSLPAAGLEVSDRQDRPVEMHDTEGRMRNVPLPADWRRGYFTPVTRLNGQAFVGTTIPVVRRPQISIAKVVERVNRQIVTFDFQDGTDAVMVYDGPTGQPPEVAIQHTKPVEITRTRYIQQGGLRFPRQLSPKGCDLHIVPVTFNGGERLEGKPTTVHYPKLLRISYDLKLQRSLLGGLSGVAVTFSSELSVRPPSFVLVYNAERLPLSSSDGTVLTVIPDGMEGVPPSKLIALAEISPQASVVWKSHPDAFKAEVKAATGYLRAFAALPSHALVQVALLDPAPSSLRLTSLLGKFGGGGG